MANDWQFDPRVILALDRTLLAWTRTAIALMAFGLVMARLGIIVRELVAAGAGEPDLSGAAAIGVALVAMGGVVQAIGVAAHMRSVARLRAGEALHLRMASPAVLLGIAVVGGAIAAAIYLSTV